MDVYKEMALKSRQLEVEVTKYKEKMNEMDYLSKRVEVKDRLEKEQRMVMLGEGGVGGLGRSWVGWTRKTLDLSSDKQAFLVRTCWIEYVR